MDWSQTAVTFAAAAGGFLSMAKLMKVMERRPAARAAEASRTERLFPNGEKDEIIARINELTIQNRERRKEHAEITAALQDLSARLERAGF